MLASRRSAASWVASSSAGGWPGVPHPERVDLGSEALRRAPRAPEDPLRLRAAARPARGSARATACWLSGSSVDGVPARLDVLRDLAQSELAQRGEVVDAGRSSAARPRPARADRPCRPRRRSWSASGDRSTSTTSSASSRIRSGNVSRTRTPVSSKIASLRLSRCWTLTVEMTSMPGVEDLVDVLVALLVAHAGARSCGRARRRARARARGAITASTSISVELEPAVLGPQSRHDLEPLGERRGLGPVVRLEVADHDVAARRRRLAPLLRACGRSCRPLRPCRAGSGSGLAARRHAPRRLWTTRSISLIADEGQDHARRARRSAGSGAGAPSRRSRGT